MRVLVTGHKGYIGTIMVPMLLEAGFDVVGLDSDLYRNSTFGKDIESVPEIAEVPEINLDIRDVDVHDLAGFEAIIHLAGLSNDPLGNLNPDLTFEINHRASVRLAQLAKEAGVERFVFSSSCSNYGAGGDDLIDENGAFNPVTPYGRSKVRVEQDVSRLADDDFSPTFLRNATAFGVSPRLRFDLVLNNLVAWACTTGRIFIKSDGTPWRPIVHIADISRAFIAVLNAPREKVHNEAFNVGRNEDNYRIRDIANIVRDVVPNCEIEYAKDAGPDKRNYRVDSSKIQRVLPGFQPQWTARKGAEELFHAFKNAGLTPDDFEGPKFKRIDHIKKLIHSQKLDESLRWTVPQFAELEETV
ncbi:MAG: NAD-dependent epimerase/dehydratase family protein [Actinobacteria bacterium]|nr:NAD-dependent epimerase/dehydratase family protein [Actinomycetota bacterium]